MRRRALLAASAAEGGNKPPFEFPLYITADTCEKDSLGHYICGSRNREPDFYKNLKDYLSYLGKTYGTDGNEWYLEDLEPFGASIYIDIEGQWIKVVGLCVAKDGSYVYGALDGISGAASYIEFYDNQIEWEYQL